MEKRFELFTTLIAKCSRSIKRIKSVEMEEFNLKSPHVSALYYLYVNDGSLTAKELCDICDEDKAYVSRSLDSLESEGYISCESKTAKRYKSPITLTEKGKQVAKCVTQKVDAIVDNASVGLTEKDRQVFYATLNLISNNLDKIIEKYGDTNED